MLLLFAKHNHRMNKRIEELAEQAGYEKDEFGVGHWDMPQCKKFAELIVRECIAMADDFEWDDGRRGLVDQMKQHFGVEE